jgi:plasmid stabilization system protein ParE
MATPIGLHRLAVEEARAERRYYARMSSALANRFLAELDEAIARVSANPQIWPAHHHHTRICRLRRFPFYLVFLEEPSTVLVLAVAHNNRNPGYWRRRIP